MNNIKDSLLFLSICRNTIQEIAIDKDLKYFIQTEASDYQIMGIIINNKIPIEKYNITKENELWVTFQNLIYENYENKIYELIVEMSPICQYNLSSSKIILEFLRESSDQQKYVQGLYNNMKSAMKATKNAMNKGTKAAASTAIETAGKGSMGKIAVGITAGAAISIIIFAAEKIHQNYLSKAAKICKGKPEKIACIRQFKNKAMRMRIEKLRSGMSSCNKAKNSDTCKKSLQSQISKLQVKADKI